jgi:hypothetical protein
MLLDELEQNTAYKDTRIIEWLRRASQDTIQDGLSQSQWQRQYFLLMPEIDSRPWHEPSEYSWTLLFKNAKSIIFREFENLLQSGKGFQPYLEGAGRNKYWTGAWNACFLISNEHEYEQNTVALPETLQLIKRVPRLGEFVMISSLNPQSRIAPHTGPWNARVTFHFGLKIPDRCSLRVADEERSWEEGEFLVFEDSFIHEAKNEGQETRFILLIDVWHPQLTDLEIEVFQRLSAEFQIMDSKAINEANNPLEGCRWWY